MGNYSNNDALEFNQLVLMYVNKILEILSKELRNRHTILPASGSRAEIVVDEEDTRKSFTQSIEGLSSILTPWFDEPTKKAYKTFDIVVNKTLTVYYDEYQKEFTKELDYEKKLKINKVDEVCSDFYKGYRDWHQIDEGKKMFRALNKLLHTNDYLKSSVYGESGDDVTDDEE